MDLAIIGIFFISLSLCTLLSDSERAKVALRTRTDWLVDGSSLLTQGLIIPVCQTLFAENILKHFFPHLNGILNWGFWEGFVLNFIVVDYFYYWNHRVLHRKKFWLIHRLHHSSKEVDVFSTSRNSWFSSFFILYFWINATFIFLLANPTGFVVSMALTAGLDLWRHSGFNNARLSNFYRLLSILFITPHEHHWHHSKDTESTNFGANLCIWDKLHGTYVSGPTWPENYGISDHLNLFKEFLYPESDL